MIAGDSERVVLTEEDAARADHYALLSHLYYGAPDASLLESIAASGPAQPSRGVSALQAAWASLRSAASAATDVAVREEYDEVFIGTGKAPVTPYATFYLSDTGRELVLVRLREELAGLGLARRHAAHEPEDHVAGLFDVMRYLIQAGPSDDAVHKRFFSRYVEPAYAGFCDAILACGRAEFYRPVAVLTREFLRVESLALKFT